MKLLEVAAIAKLNPDVGRNMRRILNAVKKTATTYGKAKLNWCL